MGILSEAQAMSALTGKPLQDCKRARKAHDAEIRAALNERREEDPAKVMCEVVFGQLDTAVSTATTKGAQPGAGTKGMPEPDTQVQPDEPEAQVTPEPDMDATDVLLPPVFEDTADEAIEAAQADEPKVTKKKTKKKSTRRSQ